MDRKYYINNETNSIYKLDNYGFDYATKEKRVILRELETGNRWDMPTSQLATVKLNAEGRIIDQWSAMPEGWFPTKEYPEEKPYQGFTNDPRKEVDEDGYDVYGIRNTTPSTKTADIGRRYTGFKR